MVKARSAGSFLGGIFNNPGIIILGALAIALLFFQKDIKNAFGSLGSSLGDITLPEINLPTINLPTINLPSFEFPSFEFPKFEFPSIFGGNGLEQPQKMVEDTGLLTQEETLACECGSTITQDAFGNVNNVCKQCAVVDTALPSLDPALNVPVLPAGTGSGILDVINFLGLTPAQEFVSNLPGGFEVFQTPGSSFVGAQINPTPIQNLSLSQIIDMFDVTASQAANIKAISEDDFGDFDFGTNTGGGIGSVIPSIQQFIGGSDVNVSSSQFEGLSAQEIANILTGGNIQNF